MRFGQAFTALRQQEPAPVPLPPPTDAAGHVFDAARYRINADGSPMLTAAGTFRLRPGKKHA